MVILSQVWEIGVVPIQKLCAFFCLTPVLLCDAMGVWTQEPAVGGWIELTPKLVFPAATCCSLRSSEGLRPPLTASHMALQCLALQGWGNLHRV